MPSQISPVIQISPIIPDLIPLLLKKYKSSKELISYLMKLMSLGKFFDLFGTK